jgi:hypothetical protein
VIQRDGYLTMEQVQLEQCLAMLRDKSLRVARIRELGMLQPQGSKTREVELRERIRKVVYADGIGKA